MGEKLLHQLGVDRLPFHQRDARVTDLMDLTGKVAIVTAGAGPILGQAIVGRLAGLGATVAVFDLDGAAAQRVAEQTTAKWGTPAIGVAGDATDAEDVTRALADITEKLGPVDILVNNLGLRVGEEFLVDRTVAAIQAEMNLTFLAPVLWIRAVGAQMLKRGGGRIINIASEGGKGFNNGLSIYNSMKSAVIGLTRNLSHEFAGTGVSLVSVLPGIMLTDAVIERMRALPDDSTYPIAETIGKVACRRGSLPEEVANMVAFLATEAGSYVEATAVSVGGGLTSW